MNRHFMSFIGSSRSNRRSIACLVVLSLLIGAKEAAPAPSIVGDTYNDAASVNCAGKKSCDAIFAKIPAGKSLVIDYVSCTLTLASRPAPSVMQLDMGSMNEGYYTVKYALTPLTLLGADAGRQKYAVATAMRVGIPAGLQPAVRINLADPSSIYHFSCYLNGARQ